MIIKKVIKTILVLLKYVVLFKFIAKNGRQSKRNDLQHRKLHP